MDTKGRLALVILTAVLAGADVSAAELRLPSVIGEHMVLQRGGEAAIWGWDAPGTPVVVAFRGKQAGTTSGADGRWQVRVPTGEAGGPFTLRINGSTTVELQDVLVGEVWIAGGQSNMWWHVSACVDKEAEIAAAEHPQVRLWDANTSPNQGGWPAEAPQTDVKAAWKVCSPAMIADFPGVPYFFARDLQAELHVPVGIVQTSVPGTEIELWLRYELLERAFSDVVERWKLATELQPVRQKAYESALSAWQAAGAVASSKPKEPLAPPGRPGCLFNGMIAPVIPFTCRGFLWWQGCYNANRAAAYDRLQQALIRDWRHLWGQDEAPFLFVELANFGAGQGSPVEDAPWPALRDSQRRAEAATPGSYLVSAIDILTPGEHHWEIHPSHKQIVGRRLYLAALANVYGSAIAWSGPRFAKAAIDGGKVTISFTHVAGGLQAKGGALKGFTLAGSDRVWHWADAAIVGDQVVATSNEVPAPVAVRYAWANDPIGNLYNAAELPCSPFRSDDWVLMPR